MTHCKTPTGHTGHAEKNNTNKEGTRDKTTTKNEPTKDMGRGGGRPPLPFQAEASKAKEEGTR